MQRLRPIHWLRTHQRGADLLLALFVSASSLLVHLLLDGPLARDDPEAWIREPTWWSTVLVVLASFPIYWRRSRPVASAVFVVAAQVAATSLQIQAGSFLGVVVALYSLGAHAEGTRRTRAAVGSAALIAVLFISGVATGNLEIGNFISSTIILVTAFVLGDNLRRRREHLDSLAERAERAEREQFLLAQRQVTAERTRIARELHDVVAHSVSVMVIQAAAARRNVHAAPDLAADTLATLEQTGRQTMQELRGILGVLRRDTDADGGGDLAPQPTLLDLAALVDRDVDLPIRLTVHDDLSRIPRSISMTGFRVVQEALTNVRRHAGPVRRVEIAVTCAGHELQIDVADDGRGAAADETSPGFGLIGMRERVTAVGGSVEAGPRRGGGWHVNVRLPLGVARHDVAREQVS